MRGLWAFLALPFLFSALGLARARRRARVEDTIQEIEEEYLDELLEEGKHVLLFLSQPGCPECTRALRELEKVDDEMESRDIAVVKSSEDELAEELGVETRPGLVYFRRHNPILYDGEFASGEEILRWVLAHGEVVTVELEDGEIDERSDGKAALPWLLMFHDEEDEECSRGLATLEAAAHRLRGQVDVGRLDYDEADDTAARLGLRPDDDCPAFLLLHKEKLYRLADSSPDLPALLAFALHKYKEQRGQPLPPPPPAVLQAVEEFRENCLEALTSHPLPTIGLGSVAVLALAAFFLRRRRRMKED